MKRCRVLVKWVLHQECQAPLPVPIPLVISSPRPDRLHVGIWECNCIHDLSLSSSYALYKLSIPRGPRSKGWQGRKRDLYRGTKNFQIYPPPPISFVSLMSFFVIINVQSLIFYFFYEPRAFVVKVNYPLIWFTQITLDFFHLHECVQVGTSLGERGRIQTSFSSRTKSGKFIKKQDNYVSLNSRACAQIKSCERPGFICYLNSIDFSIVLQGFKCTHVRTHVYGGYAPRWIVLPAEKLSRFWKL